jgi:hypothetical protein
MMNISDEIDSLSILSLSIHEHVRVQNKGFNRQKKETTLAYSGHTDSRRILRNPRPLRAAVRSANTSEFRRDRNSHKSRGVSGCSYLASLAFRRETVSHFSFRGAFERRNELRGNSVHRCLPSFIGRTPNRVQEGVPLRPLVCADEECLMRG